MKHTSLILVCLAAQVFAGETSDLVVGQKFTIDSKVMGETRTVLVGLPDGYHASETRHPVLYMTDGDFHIRHTSGTVDYFVRNSIMPNMIIVGVTNTDRTRDLTPTPAANMATAGGAERFLKFFTDELVPEVEKRYRTMPYKVFAGHSFGGIFALNAFMNHPGTFDAYIAASPSLWWDDQLLVKQLAPFLAAGKAQGTLFLTVGNEGPRMEDPLNAYCALLEKNNTPGFVWARMDFDDENHGSVVQRSYYYGLKKVFEGWQPPPGLDFEHMHAHYSALSKRLKMEIGIPEQAANAIGYGLLTEQKYDQAIKVFQWNVDTYPGSANVYDSLGEALEKAGQLKASQTSYEKAWQLGKLRNDTNTVIFKNNYDRVSDQLKKSGT